MFNEMMRAEIWLQDHLESQQGIDDLASRLGYSTSQIRRSFKQHFGLSPSAYRDRLRLEKAARLLVLTPHSISAIASECGYLNHSAFSRAFYRYHGLTPRRFRQAQRHQLRNHRYEGEPPGFTIREHAPRQALVTRVYRTPRHVSDLGKWAKQSEGASSLPGRVKQSPAVAVLQHLPPPGSLERIDLGLVVDPKTTDGVAIPSSFRVVELPPGQHACVVINDFNDVSPTLDYLLSEGLPSRERYANGQAAQVHWHPQGVELQLPLLDTPKTQTSPPEDT